MESQVISMLFHDDSSTDNARHYANEMYHNGCQLPTHRMFVPIVKRDKKKSLRVVNSSRQRKSLFYISKKFQKHDLYLPLHALWTNYVKDLFGTLDKGKQIRTKKKLLYNASKIGALLTVVGGANEQIIGLCGIVLKDKQKSFTIVTSSNRIKIVPKVGCIYVIPFDGNVYTFYENVLFKNSNNKPTNTNSVSVLHTLAAAYPCCHNLENQQHQLTTPYSSFLV
jgi:ribonuclease P protein subunit POP4